MFTLCFLCRFFSSKIKVIAFILFLHPAKICLYLMTAILATFSLSASASMTLTIRYDGSTSCLVQADYSQDRREQLESIYYAFLGVGAHKFENGKYHHKEINCMSTLIVLRRLIFR